MRPSYEEAVRDVGPEDAAALASIHVQAFSDFFLTSLGERFLVRFYRSFLAQTGAVGLAVAGNNDCIGFAVGSQSAIGFYRQLARSDGLGLLYAAFPALVRRPSRIVRIARSISGASYALHCGDSVLCSICVSPAAQRKGIGSVLLRSFEDRMRSLGCRYVVLTTDADGNEATNGFYASHGYHLSRTTTVSGRRLNCYRKPLGADECVFGFGTDRDPTSLPRASRRPVVVSSDE